MEQELSNLAKLSPIIAVLIVVIIMLYKRLNERETTLESRLNEKDKMFLDSHMKSVEAIHNNTASNMALIEYLKERSKK